MARQLFRFAVSTPAGTLLATPQKTELAIPPRIVDEVEIVVPPGPRGELGFALAMAGNPIIPANPGAWIVSDDETIHWPLEDFPTSGAWQLLSYNTGAFAHTIEIRFLTRIPGESVDAGSTAPLPLDSLAPAAALPLTPRSAAPLGGLPLLPFQSLAAPPGSV